MTTTTASLVAALVGAIIGSVGAVVIQSLLSAKAERNRQREVLVQRYLFQLQDSIESLWYRLKNLADLGGRQVMEDDYFTTSSLYSLGRVLALERILMLEGVYPQLQILNPGLGSFLATNRVDRKLTPLLYQYDRLALAEAVMEREGPHFRTSTYLEFSTRFQDRHHSEGSPFSQVLGALESLYSEDPAASHPLKRYRELATSGGAEIMKDLMALLRVVAVRLAEETGIPTSLGTGIERDGLPAGATWTARPGSP